MVLVVWVALIFKVVSVGRGVWPFGGVGRLGDFLVAWVVLVVWVVFGRFGGFGLFS